MTEFSSDLIPFLVPKYCGAYVALAYSTYNMVSEKSRRIYKQQLHFLRLTMLQKYVVPEAYNHN